MKYTHYFGLFLLFFIVSAFCNAQNYSFHYNARGHRDARILLKSATIPADSVLAKEQNKPLEDLIGLQKTRIYPNPTKGVLKIDLPALADQDAVITVYDSNGKLVIQKNAVELSNDVDLSSFPSGFYILSIQIGRNNRKEWKIIKE